MRAEEVVEIAAELELEARRTERALRARVADLERRLAIADRDFGTLARRIRDLGIALEQARAALERGRP